ncbi:MAG: beta-propeller fold lactonase family protein [Solirubrobacteraceae bacterium]
MARALFRMPVPRFQAPKWLLLTALLALTVPGAALGAASPHSSRQPVSALGALSQLSGKNGCVAGAAKPRAGCRRVRALSGPAPLLGSHAIAISPDGRNVYVASSKSNAIAVFTRSARTGALTQRSGRAGCIAARGGGGCARGIGLGAPNSVAVSPDGRNVYATSLVSRAVVILRRNRRTGALTQLGTGSGCIADSATPGCTTGRALDGPDIVAVSPDGKSVYVGAFAGSALAVFSRNPSTGALTQPTDATGCFVNTPTSGCTTALALGSPEGVTVSGDGKNVYVAAPGSDALDTFARNTSNGTLTQATDGTGCISSSAVAGCTLGIQMAGADAVVVSPNDGDIYVTSLVSNTVTAFTRTSTGQPVQLTGTSACNINVLAVGCSLVRQLNGAEGLAVSPDGANLYAVAYTSGALDVFNRNSGSGAVTQKSRAPGCLVGSATPGCTPARALHGASSIVVSPDGRNVYAAAFKSNAVAVFKRVTKSMTR